MSDTIWDGKNEEPLSTTFLFMLFLIFCGAIFTIIVSSMVYDIDSNKPGARLETKNGR